MSEETKRDKNSLRELFKRIDDDYYFFRGLHNREDFVLKKTDKGVRFIIHGTEYDEKSSEIIKGYVGINNDNVPCFMALLGFVDRDFFSDRLHKRRQSQEHLSFHGRLQVSNVRTGHGHDYKRHGKAERQHTKRRQKHF